VGSGEAPRLKIQICGIFYLNFAFEKMICCELISLYKFVILKKKIIDKVIHYHAYLSKINMAEGSSSRHAKLLLL
jgi:hypothetical protein